MFANYLKIALRNLLKNKIYSGINILGLSLGFICGMLIMLHVKDELSYDKFIPNHENLYRVALERIYPDHSSYYAIIPDSYSEVMAEEIKGVEESVRLFDFGNSNIVEVGDLKIEERNLIAADSNFYDVFKFEILQGNENTALTEPNTVVLTQATSQRLFPEQAAIGKSVRLFGQDYAVTAVMENVPENSHLKFDYLFSSTSFPGLAQENFTGFSAYTYLKLSPEIDPSQVEASIPGLVNKYAAGQIERDLGVSFAEYTKAGNGYRYFLQPIASIHLNSNLEAEMKANGNSLYVYIFISIAIFILVLACINFINLATARSSDRAKEVGVRKAMGSPRSQIITQFLLEAIVLTFISLAIGIVLVSFVLPFFNQLAEKSLKIDLQAVMIAVPVLIVFGLVIGFLAGYYPAFYISKLNTISILKGKLQVSGDKNWLRNGLVVFQFAIAIILISGTLIVNKQIQFIQSTSLGFQKENVVIIDRFGNQENQEVIRKEIERFSEVLAVGTSSSMPGKRTFGAQFTTPGDQKVLTTKSMSGDEDFFKTLGIAAVSGRVFQKEFNDSLSLILNQEAVKVFFGESNPLGKKLLNTANINGENVTSELTVVGVVDNFNFESLHSPVTPLAIFNIRNGNGFPNFLTIRYAGSDQAAILKKIESTWAELSDGSPLAYSFMDGDLAELYQNERVSGQILAVFSILAIIIACIGLFGLAAYTAFLRTKEIGVRKVLGASVGSIVVLLSLNFAKLVGIAFVIAIPLAWLMMNNWLHSFAFKIELGIWVFAIAGLITLAIALATVSYQAIAAAVVNPVKSLKSE
jgi:putative ABC transport system permease protein